MAVFYHKQEELEMLERRHNPDPGEQLMEKLMEQRQEAASEGVQTMEDYYRHRMEKMEKQAQNPDDNHLGGWHAGYTPAEWRRMADKEYAKNGNTIEYRKCIQNAQKAEG